MTSLCTPPTHTQDWQCLARAFYALAHNDPGDFNQLEQELKDSEVGKLCAEYLRSGDYQCLERAGFLLTGTEHWYVYLGRHM